MKSTLIHAFSSREVAGAGGSLRKRVFRGGFWIFGLRIIDRGLGFLRKLVLARLLAPEDFGLLGISFLAISTLETFSQTGFQAALVQKKENVDSYLDTAWTVSVLRGVILFAILVLFAPYIGEFFNSQEAVAVIRVIAITVLLSGAKNVGVVFFEKELQFKKQFIYQVSGTLSAFCVGILLAFALKNAWALVFAGLVGKGGQFLASYMVHSFRPRIRFEKQKLRELVNFGKWIFGQSIVLFLLTQGDDIFVGKMLGVTALGFYQMAYAISSLPATEVTHVISGVAFPAYSKIQDDLPRLKEACLKVLRLTCAISIPFATGLAVFAPELTALVLKEKWMPMVAALQVMCVFGAMRSIAATFGPIYRAIGRPDIPFRINLIHLLVLSLTIYPLGMRWEILGVSVAISVSMIVALILTSIRIMAVLQLRFLRAFTPVIISTSASVTAAVVVCYLRTFTDTQHLHSLFLILALGVITYLASVKIGHRVFLPQR
jgi:O-antigen/teichoic acid export membrane protein